MLEETPSKPSHGHVFRVILVGHEEDDNEDASENVIQVSVVTAANIKVFKHGFTSC